MRSNQLIVQTNINRERLNQLRTQERVLEINPGYQLINTILQDAPVEEEGEINEAPILNPILQQIGIVADEIGENANQAHLDNQIVAERDVVVQTLGELVNARVIELGGLGRPYVNAVMATGARAVTYMSPIVGNVARNVVNASSYIGRNAIGIGSNVARNSYEIGRNAFGIGSNVVRNSYELGRNAFGIGSNVARNITDNITDMYENNDNSDNDDMTEEEVEEARREYLRGLNIHPEGGRKSKRRKRPRKRRTVRK